MRLTIALCALLATTSSAEDVALRIGPDTRAMVPAGKEVDAIDGDLLLKNKHVTAVIAHNGTARNANMTVRSVAGALIDLTENSSNSDQLSAFYPGRRAHRWAGETVGWESRNGGPRYGVATFFDRDSSVVVEYALMHDASAIRVRTTFTNRTTAPQTVKLEDDIRADGGKEYMSKSPNGDLQICWIHDRFWGQAYGVISEHGRIRCNSNARESVLRYLVDGKPTVDIAPGDSFELVRWIFPAANLLDVKAAIARHRKDDVTPVTFAITDGLGRPVADAEVTVSTSGATRGSGRTGENGELTTALPPGQYSVTARCNGEDLGSDKTKSADVSVGSEPIHVVRRFAGYRPGTLTAAITDSDGQPIPCKIELLPQDGTVRPDFGPETAEHGVKNVIYTADGTARRAVPSGSYDVIVSRGPEYDALFQEITVEPGGTAQVAGKLVRSVKTPGWISCDYHSHSSPSGDNTGSQLGRVLNLVAEHVEFAPCTEHNRVSTYDNHIESLRVQKFLATVSGMELTGSPLPLNHQNVFPMVYRPYQQDGGGPQTDVSPEKQIERLASWDDRSRKLIQQNHPDLGWLFYDKNGDGKPDTGYERSFTHMDVVEIHPVYSILNLQPYNMSNGKPVRNNCVFNWLQLLNQGYRVFGIVNTDAHYNYHGSGWLRNWIRSSTDDPAQVDIEEMIANSEAGHLVMSNGPYLEATVQAAGGERKAIAGQDLNAPGGKVQVAVRVQCANWLDIDRVFILVNGRLQEELNFTRKTHPDMFADGVVKFDRTIDVPLKQDAHIIVGTGHTSRKLGPVMGPSAGRHPIAAFTNPVFVNIEGDDFTPNMDTLGHPLPVKKQP